MVTVIVVAGGKGTVGVNCTVAASGRTLSAPAMASPRPSVTCNDCEVSVAGRIGWLKRTRIGAVGEAPGVPGGGDTSMTAKLLATSDLISLKEARCRSPAAASTTTVTGLGAALSPMATKSVMRWGEVWTSENVTCPP